MWPIIIIITIIIIIIIIVTNVLIGKFCFNICGDGSKWTKFILNNWTITH
jgi:hypothetical protein